ncbi:cupin domain-containing protein [Polynucleobacter sp. MWH-Spelu-300-X4]|nr:cupin domain-containing protein [Polynucleobacter sp. MWH-Spelu-300-X4]
MKSNKTSVYQPPKPPQPLPIQETWALLGGMSPERFMKEYWQKKPLLVRGAIPAFALAKISGGGLNSPISMAELAELSSRKTVESRLVQSKPWSLNHGPFKPKTLPKLSDPDWTLLVQGVNGHHPAAKTVMSWFRFIPEARLDDLMISIAGPGGGVGPHLDSYDVFLIQMAGHRNWRISTQTDLSLKEGLPLKILKNFKPTNDWVLEPGDMLYLPPNVAHDGIAVDAGCQTWSVGFKVPNYKDLISEILWRTTEALENDPKLNQLYKDPQQRAIQDPALVPQELIDSVYEKLNKIHWSKSDISCTLASILSEPKPQTYFIAPQSLLDLQAFKKAITKQGISLSPLSKILHDQEFYYLNGESVSDDTEDDWVFWKKISINQSLTKAECIQLSKLIEDSQNPWFEAYCSGWLTLNSL